MLPHWRPMLAFVIIILDNESSHVQAYFIQINFRKTQSKHV